MKNFFHIITSSNVKMLIFAFTLNYQAEYQQTLFPYNSNLTAIF